MVTTALPASDSASLYFGDVMHARLKPMGHRFSYRVMSLLIDLDRLGEADRQTALFGVNRAALYSFHEKDHGARDGSSLRAYAERCAAAHGIDLSGGRVELLCHPRLLGCGFSPLSVYFCYRASGELALVIYEVCNSFGDIHPYVLPVKPGDLNGVGLRQQQEKLFYVSPFVPMAMRYPFSRPASIRHGQAADSGDRPRRPFARGDLQRPPPRPDLGCPAAIVLRPAARELQGDGGDPLGSAAALAEGGAAGATAECRNSARRQNHLGGRQNADIYCW
jgi:hypothetical protein